MSIEDLKEGDEIDFKLFSNDYVGLKVTWSRERAVIDKVYPDWIAITFKGKVIALKRDEIFLPTTVTEE